MSNLQAETDAKCYLLLAVRGSPDHGQDPDQPPFGVPGDALVEVTVAQGNPLDAARKLVEAFRDEHGWAVARWVGGDLWTGGVHKGHLSYNGRFHSGEAGPLVRDGKFVFKDPATATPHAALPAGKKAEDWKDLLLASVEASTDDDWYQVLAIRPDLEDRLRAVLEQNAPADAVGDDLSVSIAEGLSDDDQYTHGYRDAVESLMLALHGHVTPSVLRESVMTALDAYGNNAPEPETEDPAAGM